LIDPVFEQVQRDLALIDELELDLKPVARYPLPRGSHHRGLAAQAGDRLPDRLRRSDRCRACGCSAAAGAALRRVGHRAASAREAFHRAHRRGAWQQARGRAVPIGSPFGKGRDHSQGTRRRKGGESAWRLGKALNFIRLELFFPRLRLGFAQACRHLSDSSAQLLQARRAAPVRARPRRPVARARAAHGRLRHHGARLGGVQRLSATGAVTAAGPRPHRLSGPPAT
jgi:hypothetical protein